MSDQSTPPAPPLSSPPRRGGWFVRLWAIVPSWAGALIALVVLAAITGWYEPAFFRPGNIVNILNQNSVVGIMAVGMTLVIILGGIDLSIGSLVAFCGGVGVLVLNATYGTLGDAASVILAVMVTILVGALAGMTNGILIAFGRLAPFIATLAGLVAYRSAATWMAQGGQFFADGGEIFRELGRGVALPGTNIARAGPPVPLLLPWAVIVWSVVALLGVMVLRMTRLGRYTVAVGSNERAAIYSAVPVRTVKLTAYTILGALVGLGAILHAARYNTINSANAGLLWELDVIAAVVIGGTRMSGGSGSVIGTVLGVLLIGVIKNMLVMFDVTPYAHGLVMGGIILTAVLAQQLAQRLGGR